MKKISILDLITDLLDENEKSISDVKGVHVKTYEFPSSMISLFNFTFRNNDDDEFRNSLEMIDITFGFDFYKDYQYGNNDLDIYIVLKNGNIIYRVNPERKSESLKIINKNFIVNVFDNAELEDEEYVYLDIDGISEITIKYKNNILEIYDWEEFRYNSKLADLNYILVDELGNNFSMVIIHNDIKYELSIREYGLIWVKI